MIATPGAIRRLLASRWMAFVLRVMLTSPFWTSGLMKLADWPGALAEMQVFGLTPAAPVAGLVILVQLSGSAGLILGRGVWLAAGALGVFTFCATLIAHDFWTVAGPARVLVIASFFEHVAIIAGLALAAVLAEERR